ncbi:hypothetical protein CWI38_0802p0020 [Hamiltosporidium tvaerminnensis]|uniref:Insertion element IS150 protein InsJ-like helix-turn-helix domain-containing protein n=1 Tax=Hamiltosporidium tvaerminnensis TaxID=1176355 RepID=A0A4Q9LVC2_9MICR|nr:hypothetical protein CWI38_0802p0020 [Hamiltosporidium tvaerminnensis]
MVSNNDRERIILKTLEGHSISSIASMYRINYQTVNSIVKRYGKIGLVFVEKRSGDMPPKSTLEIKECLPTYVNSECIKTLHELVEWVKSKFNVDVSTRTIYRALREFHYTLKHEHWCLTIEIHLQQLSLEKFATNFRDRGRNMRGESVCLSKYGMIYHKIHERSVSGEDFNFSMKKLKKIEITSFQIKYLLPYSYLLNTVENVFLF